jgi:hypothetical protein
MKNSIGLAVCCLSIACTAVDPSPFTWDLQHDAERIKLIYGVYESDNIGLSLDCVAQSGVFEISAWGLSPPPGSSRAFSTRLILTAAGETFDMPATAEVTDVGDGETVVTGRPETPGLLLAALSRATKLYTATYDGRDRAPTPPAASLREFTRLCGIG